MLVTLLKTLARFLASCSKTFYLVVCMAMVYLVRLTLMSQIGEKLRPT